MVKKSKVVLLMEEAIDVKHIENGWSFTLRELPGTFRITAKASVWKDTNDEVILTCYPRVDLTIGGYPVLGGTIYESNEQNNLFVRLKEHTIQIEQLLALKYAEESSKCRCSVSKILGLDTW